MTAKTINNSIANNNTLTRRSKFRFVTLSDAHEITYTTIPIAPKRINQAISHLPSSQMAGHTVGCCRLELGFACVLTFYKIEHYDSGSYHIIDLPPHMEARPHRQRLDQQEALTNPIIQSHIGGDSSSVLGTYGVVTCQGTRRSGFTGMVARQGHPAPRTLGLSLVNGTRRRHGHSSGLPPWSFLRVIGSYLRMRPFSDLANPSRPGNRVAYVTFISSRSAITAFRTFRGKTILMTSYLNCSKKCLTLSLDSNESRVGSLGR